MSANVINSSLLLAFTLIVGGASLVIQTYFWPNDKNNNNQSGFFRAGLSALKDIWHHIVLSITSWLPGNPEYKYVLFTRLSITFVLVCLLTVIILTTYDSVSSFWVYFVLYLGVGLLALPILGHIGAKLFAKSQSQ